MLILKVSSGYSVGDGSPEAIKEFNDFYDLEEARLNKESWQERLWCHNHGIFEFIKYDYPTFQHP